MLFFLVASESLSLSFSLSLVHGSLRRHAHLSVRPSVRPARGCLCLHPHPSAFVFPFLLVGSSCLEPPSCVFGEVFPILQTREPVSGAGRGEAGLAPHPGPLSTCAHLPWVPAPRSPPCLPPQPGGFSGRAFWQRQTHGPCHAGSVCLLLRNLFPYLYVWGMGLVASSKTASVYSVN